jgi:3-hydroxyisobutyrate dehydrogenase-like beta-hydroxyacid dehydrogenase
VGLQGQNKARWSFLQVAMHKPSRIKPVYNVLSQRVTRMGDTGTGQATKICNQLIVAANSTLDCRSCCFADQAGVDTTLLAPALAGGFADSKPFQILAPRMATHTLNLCNGKFKPYQRS